MPQPALSTKLQSFPSEPEAQRFAREEGLATTEEFDERPDICSLAVLTHELTRSDLDELAQKSKLCGTFQSMQDGLVMFSKAGLKASTDFARAVCARSQNPEVSVQRMLLYPSQESLWLQTWNPKAGHWTPPKPT